MDSAAEQSFAILEYISCGEKIQPVPESLKSLNEVGSQVMPRYKYLRGILIK